MAESLSRPSTASSVDSVSFLPNLLERLSSSSRSLKLRAEDSCPVAVVALQRYLSDPGDGLPAQDDSYSYDVTITDGEWRAKCFLHPALNPTVHKNILKTGTDICITQCSYVYNERRLGHGFICIENFTCCPGVSTVCSSDIDITALPLLVKQGMERSLSLQSDVPLQVQRRHHLPLWNNDDPEGDMWTPDPPSPSSVLDVSKIAFLCNLESQFRNAQKPFPLLVKIMHKSRLRYYGKFGLKIEFPYQAYLEVADQSGAMSLVLWNDLCPQFYHRLHVGSVLHLQNYTLKQSYVNRSRPNMDHYRMNAFNSVEICLNRRNPCSVITVIPPRDVLKQWALPEVSYQFTTRSELDHLSGDSVCDVIALVTFVGRVERVRSKGNKGPEKYWSYRWIHAIDGTSDHPFIIELFSSSQPEVFQQICPMTYLVCTQMRVCQVEGGAPYLTSSCETQMYITGFHKGQPYVSDSKVKRFIAWTKTLKDPMILRRTRVGGFYRYPRAPQIFTQAVEDASALVPLVSAVDFQKEFESLQYREHKRLALQGQIEAVRFRKQTKLHENLTEEPQDPEVVRQVREDTEGEESMENTRNHHNKRRRLSRLRAQEESPQKLTPTKRSVRHENTAVQQEEEEEEEAEDSSERIQDGQSPEAAVACWESSRWRSLKQDVSVHIDGGVLFEDSLSRSFTSEQKSALSQWSNLQPGRWSSEFTFDPVPEAPWPGYFTVTVLGINRQFAVDAAFVPVASSDVPGAVGLADDSHPNTMLSCLSSGALCPLSRESRQSTQPQLEEILQTCEELDGLHVVCVLDLCHLGENRVEVLINRVYRVTEVSLV